MRHNSSMKVLEWIDVNEQSPPIDKNVLVWDCADIYEAYIDKEGNWKAVMEVVDVIDVTYWANTPYNPSKVGQILASHKK